MHRTFLLPTRNLGTTQGDSPYHFTHLNPLEPDFASAIEPSAHTAAWAGWFDEKADSARGLFPSDHRLWTTGLESLRESFASLDAVLSERDAYLSLRPACGLVLSDPHSVAALLNESPSSRLRILVDPVAMLTPEMAAHAEDHLPRMLDKLGNFETASAIILSGYGSASNDRLTHRPLSENESFDRMLIEAWQQSAFAEREVLILSDACKALIEQARIA